MASNVRNTEIMFRIAGSPPSKSLELNRFDQFTIGIKQLQARIVKCHIGVQKLRSGQSLVSRALTINAALRLRKSMQENTAICCTCQSREKLECGITAVVTRPADNTQMES